MPARPMVVDQIENKIRGAVAVDIISLTCCVCEAPTKSALVMRYKNGSTDVYGLCPGDKKKIREQHPSRFTNEVAQGVFLYP